MRFPTIEEIAESVDLKPPKKLIELRDELHEIDHKLSIWKKITTALPKHKEARYKAKIDPLTTQRTVANFNFNQQFQSFMKKVQKAEAKKIAEAAK